MIKFFRENLRKIRGFISEWDENKKKTVCRGKSVLITFVNPVPASHWIDGLRINYEEYRLNDVLRKKIALYFAGHTKSSVDKTQILSVNACR
jgi:hypothetical protein